LSYNGAWSAVSTIVRLALEILIGGLNGRVAQ
jgi:hypothetical protein